MILTLIFIFMILLGLVLIMIFGNDLDTDIDVFGTALVTFGTVLLIISVIIIIASHACADLNIKKNQINYEGLCKRYEVVKSEYEDVSKSDVINDITAWNMKVYSTKYWSENPWTNWFNPRKIADNLYYIPLDKESEETDEKLSS